MSDAKNIDIKDIAKFCIPYPDQDSGLAKIAHMYICIYADDEIRLLKCQSWKPIHLHSDSLPQKRFVISSNVIQPPFTRQTIIDLDKVFIGDKTSEYVIVGELSDEMFNELISQFNYDDSEKIIMSDLYKSFPVDISTSSS
ncbi:MAG: hypothetical protein LBC86_05165 [Oscillospiraceae bacterium]|nr:hypothetical protein [Oscillospiraceae bacterium]